MALSPKIEVRQNQSLVMTPQLRQAIKLLRMSNIELSEFVSGEVEKNPLLEIAQQSPLTPSTAGHSGSGSRDQPEGDFLQRLPAEVTLWDHLHAQIRAMRLPPDLIEAALIVADELEEDGYLRADVTEVAERHHLRRKEVLQALQAVQACEPAGIGARNLPECLALQLREQNRFDPAMQKLLENLSLALRGPSPELQRVCGVGHEDIEEMIAEIRSLDPKPGLRYRSEAVQVAIPDVRVRKTETGGLRVELNTDTLPRVLMDNVYEADLASGDSSAKAFVSECRTSANWLLRALEQRARTILKVSGEIVSRQERFFSDGVSALRPLTRRDVADAIGMHESTVSRVTSGKYLSCEQGCFELRYFFNSAIPSATGGEAFSATAVQDRIRALADAEDPKRVLSDDKIVAVLKGEGISIARRTVAKYREVMGIPASTERRRRKTMPSGSP